MAQPIWKDIFYTADTEFNFTLEAGGETLYSGRADLDPTGVVKINISRLVELHFRNDIDVAATGVTKDLNAYKTIQLRSNDILLASYDMVFCYDYQTRNVADKQSMSDPVNGHLDPRMKIFYTSFRNTGSTFCYTIGDL